MDYETLGKAASDSFNLRPDEIEYDLKELTTEVIEANMAAMEIHSEPLRGVIQKIDEFVLQVMNNKGLS